MNAIEKMFENEFISIWNRYTCLGVEVIVINKFNKECRGVSVGNPDTLEYFKKFCEVVRD